MSGSAYASALLNPQAPSQPGLTPEQQAMYARLLANPVGTEHLGGDTSLSMPSSDVSPVVGSFGAHPVTAATNERAQQIASVLSQFGPADVGAIKAFHGSPADFNAFSDKYIGTGEGAQAFGYGHYGAGAEGTAKTYKRPSKTLEWNGQPVEAGQPAYDLVDALSNQDWRLGKIVEQATKYGPANAVETFEPHTRNASDGAAWRAAMDQFKAGAGKSATGHMYELAIHADPEHMLDWDKPLSEQSQHVRDAIEKLPPPRKDLLFPIDQHSLGRDYVSGYSSAQLHEAGIPGIKYLDQGSRAQGEGTSNYVVFDPATIEILRKYGIAGLIAGGGAAAATGAQQPEQ